MAITFQLPRSQHLPCLALGQHEECDMFFSPGIKKYQKIFHVSRDGIEAIQDNFDFQDGIYADAKEKVPEITILFIQESESNSFIDHDKMKNIFIQKNWHDCDVRTPGCRTHARLAMAPSPLLLSGGSGNQQRTTHSTAQLWSLPTSISI